MRSVGLITEYNPFHNGHLYHLRQSRQLADAEVAVAVMSGHFLQRGEPALLDKWQRTRMALAAGVDVVVELPFPWACSSAPQFAAGALAALEALGGIDALCFGSEHGELEPLRRCADRLLEQSTAIKSNTARLLKAGMTYPAAREQVVREITGDSADADLLRTPNNILGIAYLQALKQAGSAIQPLTLRRIGAGFHELEAVAGIASATGIRQMLAAGAPADEFLPEASATLLSAALEEGKTADPGLLHRLLLGSILRDAERLPSYYQVDNGLENRLLGAAADSHSFEELVAAVKSRQLTRTRIQRVLIYVLLGICRDPMQQALATGPLYLHLLGCSRRGRQYLAATRKQRSLPLLQNFSRVHAILKRRYGAESRTFRDALTQLRFQERATACYQLLLPKPSSTALNRDYHTELITIS